jgi:monoamine oxidase
VPDLPDSTYLHRRDADADDALYFARPGGGDYVLALFGGRRARKLEAQGQAAFVDAAMAGLVDLFGTDLQHSLRAAVATAWSADPWARGSYAIPRPGAAGLRAALAAPHGERILFAGEATATDGWAATVAGATLSGRRAATEALAHLDRETASSEIA